jgi:hypothetical protein
MVCLNHPFWSWLYTEEVLHFFIEISDCGISYLSMEAVAFRAGARTKAR